MSYIIKALRKERGLSQKALIAEIGEYNVSLRTLRRIESGDKVSRGLMDEILRKYNISLPYQLRDEREAEIMDDILSDSCLAGRVSDLLEEASGRIREYRASKFEDPESVYDYPITHLQQLLIYLPLMEINDIYNALLRVGGDIGMHRFDYTLQQLAYIYKRIPESELKEIADKLARRADGEDIEITLEEWEAYIGNLEKMAERYIFLKGC